MENLIERINLLIKKDNLKARCRYQNVVNKRFYLFYILRDYGYTYNQIGDFFDLNHATVIHGVKKYKALKKNRDTFLEKDIQEYKILLGEIEVNYDLKQDILKATTIGDLNRIKKKTEENKYNELK
jgi:hypothetical protein